jgi:hypothetical protein
MPPLRRAGRSPVSDDDRLAEQILDLLVYAPIGLALEAKELIPKLADRGRGQIALARLAGKVASDRGQSDVRTFLEQLIGAVGSSIGDTPSTPDEPDIDPSDDASGLAIDSYDSLTAPQLLPHLPPLSAKELDEILSYEQAHRSRATVINRIRQLQD